jgi:hypothetical protein
MYQLQNWLIQEEDQMSKQVRWKCAICDHGLLAPTKPRKNDVRRYCLPCSSKSGKLVERVAPSLEKKREQRSAVVREQNKIKRERTATKLQPLKERQKREAQRQRIFEKEADRIWALFFPNGTARKRPPIKLVYSRSRGVSGLWNGWEVLVRIPRSSKGGATAWETLAHELCHAVVGSRHDDREGWHGRTFYTTLKPVIEKRWNVRMDWSFINGYTDTSKSWGYKVDWEMTDQLKKSGKVRFEYHPDDLEVG